MTEAIRRAAETFWNLAGDQEPFPRSLQKPVLWTLPLGVMLVPNLWLHNVYAWSAKNGADFSNSAPDRRLRGCLVAIKGTGIVFLDGTDDESERTYTLAHEVSHFLLDHYFPRLKLVELFGPSIAEVLDGRRQPTVEERLAGVLLGQNLRPNLHCIDRDDTGLYMSERTRQMENDADVLAIELLAPEVAVIRASGGKKRANRADLCRVLEQGFGLPAKVAGIYATELARRWGGPPSFRSWLTDSEKSVEL